MALKRSKILKIKKNDKSTILGSFNKGVQAFKEIKPEFEKDTYYLILIPDNIQYVSEMFLAGFFSKPIIKGQITKDTIKNFGIVGGVSPKVEQDANQKLGDLWLF